MSTKILCVDDDANILEAYQRNFRKRFSIDTALGGELGLALMTSGGPYAVVIADMQMPGMNGVEFLKKARTKAPDTVRVMLTGNADQKTATEAVNQGQIFQFLNKPCPPESLGVAIDNAIQQHRLITAERELLENTLNGSIKLLMEVLGSVQPAFFGRGEVLRNYMRQFAASLKITQTWDLEIAAMLSPLGFVTLPAELIKKMNMGISLTGPEKDLVRRVPEVGANLLSHIPRLETVSKIVLYQNKNYDGTNFPVNHVAGDDIPVGARILKVLSDLLHLEAAKIPRFKALEQMQARVGFYDPRVLDTAFVCFDIYLETATSAKASGKPISLKELAVGQVLCSNIETEEGVLMAPAGTTISPFILERLRSYQELNRLKEPIRIAI
jgi:response regulator RpfG family c-di-GMP phosphodiesterase